VSAVLCTVERLRYVGHKLPEVVSVRHRLGRRRCRDEPQRTGDRAVGGQPAVRQRAAGAGPDEDNVVHRETHACLGLGSWTLVPSRQEHSADALLAARRLSTEP